ncbi:hypothetical protein B296_00032297, partial [Ensete ventricosum]
KCVPIGPTSPTEPPRRQVATKWVPINQAAIQNGIERHSLLASLILPSLHSAIGHSRNGDEIRRMIDQRRC